MKGVKKLFIYLKTLISGVSAITMLKTMSRGLSGIK